MTMTKGKFLSSASFRVGWWKERYLLRACREKGTELGRKTKDSARLDQTVKEQQMSFEKLADCKRYVGRELGKFRVKTTVVSMKRGRHKE